MPTQRQIEAYRRNWAKHGPITPAGRERLRQAALRDRPWEHSTGPRTPAGKAKSRENALWLGDYAKVIEPHASLNTLSRIRSPLVLVRIAEVACSWAGMRQRLTDQLGIDNPLGNPDDLAGLARHLLDSDDQRLVVAGIDLWIFIETCSVRLEEVGAGELLDALEHFAGSFDKAETAVSDTSSRLPGSN